MKEKDLENNIIYRIINVLFWIVILISAGIFMMFVKDNTGTSFIFLLVGLIIAWSGKKTLLYIFFGKLLLPS